MNIIKKSQDVPIRSKGPKTSVPLDNTKPSPTKETVVSNKPARNNGRGKTSHAFSENVKTMQNALLRVGREFRIGYPEIFADSDAAQQGKGSNGDPQLVKKIQDISKHIGNQADYADGLWGPKTQDALNSVYEYIQNMAKVMGKGDDPKYVELLKQLSNAGIGPGKKYTDIPAANVSAYAKTITDSIHTMYTVVLDDMHKYFANLKNQKPGQPAQPEAPGQTVNQTQSGQSGVVPASLKDETQQQDQPGTGVKLSEYPFDMEGDIISMQRFRQFLTQAAAWSNTDAIKNKLGSYAETLNTQITAALTSIGRWEGEARRTSSSDGFSLTVGTDTDALVNAYFNHDYVAGRNLLLMLDDIFSWISNILNIVRTSKSFDQTDDADIRNQIQRGHDYIGRVSVMVSKIEAVLKSGQQPSGNLYQKPQQNFETPPPPPGPPPPPPGS